MKQLILKLLKHPLISGSGLLFLGSLMGNFFHFLFNLFMSRSLSISDYGILASIFSLTTLPSLLYSAITPTVVSFAAVYFAKNEITHVHGLFVRINRVALSVGALFFLAFIIFSSQIGSFLHISNSPHLILLGSLMVFIGFVSIVNTSFIQAKLAFHFLSLIYFLTGFLKFLFGLLFIYVGFNVGGALGAIILSGIVIYIVSFYPIKFIFYRGVVIPHISLKEILSFALPATFSLFSITCFITVDILLMKHFFSPKDAGLYAGLALIGKVIFFFSSPIASVMFPLIVQKKAKNENYLSLFSFSLILVLIPSLALTAFYYLFPHFSILFFLKKTEYLQIAPLLWYYGLYMTVFSLLSVFVNYFLSVNKTSIFIPLVIGAGLQAILLWIFHDSFFQVITISFVLICLLIVIMFYYFYRFYARE